MKARNSKRAPGMQWVRAIIANYSLRLRRSGVNDVGRRRTMERVVTGMRLGCESSVVVKVGDDGCLVGGGCGVVVEGKVVRSTESGGSADPLGEAVRLTPIIIIITITLIVINIARL